MKKTTYSATLPDGSVATRSTDRSYSHLIAGRYPQGWAPARWTADPVSALAQMNGTKKFGFSSGPFKHISGHDVAFEFVAIAVTIRS